LDAFAWPYVVYGSPSDGQQTSISPTPVTVYNLTSDVATPLPQVTGSILALDGAALFYTTAPGSASNGSVTLDEFSNLAQPNAPPRALATLPSSPTTTPVGSLGVTERSVFYTVTSVLFGSGCRNFFDVICPTTTPTAIPTPPVTTLYEVDIPGSGAPVARAIAAYKADLGGVAMANDRLVVLAGGAVWDRAEGRFVDLGTGLGSANSALQEVNGAFLLVAHALAQNFQSPYKVSIYDTTRLPTLQS
jgi:hypothetical protein